jgi:putative membrane protein
MLFGPILWLILLGLIVAGIVWAVRAIEKVSGSSPKEPESNPLDVPRVRYARGDIDSDEFEERRQKLLR